MAKSTLRTCHASLWPRRVAWLAACIMIAESSFAAEPCDDLLEEVLATGQKRVQRLQEVPLSVTALNELLFEDMGAFNFVLGGFYCDSDRALQVMDGGALFGLPGDYTNSTDSRVRTYAGFGEADYQLTERLQLIGGLRWFRVEFEDAAVTLVGDLTVGETDLDSVFRSAAPKLGLCFDYTDEILLFANIAQGFRSGGKNQLIIDHLDFEPTLDEDSAWSYEAGFKFQFYDCRMTVNGAVFYTDWKDIQILGLTDLPALGFTTNAGSAHTAGFELEVLARSEDGLNLSFGAGYVEAELDEPVQGTPVGAALPNVPKWGLNAAAQYRHPLYGTANGFARLDWQYKSDTNGNILGTGLTGVPSYHIVNARVGPLGRITVRGKSKRHHGHHLGSRERAVHRPSPDHRRQRQDTVMSNVDSTPRKST